MGHPLMGPEAERLFREKLEADQTSGALPKTAKEAATLAAKRNAQNARPAALTRTTVPVGPSRPMTPTTPTTPPAGAHHVPAVQARTSKPKSPAPLDVAGIYEVHNRPADTCRSCGGHVKANGSGLVSDGPPPAADDMSSSAVFARLNGVQFRGRQ